jgi:hypothetical protein
MTPSPDREALKAIEAALKAWSDRRLTARETLDDILDVVVARELGPRRRRTCRPPQAANAN